MRLPHAPHALAGLLRARAGRGSSNLARFDGVRYGLRAAGARRTAGHVHAHARRRLRRRGQAAHHARHLRALVAATTTPTTAARSGCARRSPRTSRRPSSASTSSSRRPRPTVAFKLGEKTGDPLSMYLNDFCTVPMSLAGIPAISIPCGCSAKGCRSASRSRARRSARTGCSTRRTRSSGRSASTGAGAWLSGRTVTPAARASSPSSGWRSTSSSRPRTKMFCGCALSLRRPAEHAHLPGLPRPARQPAGHQRARRALRADDRPRARLRARAALDLPPQELLLSRPAEGLPDLPVRRAAVPRRRARRGAHPPRAPGGGRGQAHPRRRERAHPRLRRERRRLQPRRHAAGGDRHRARPALARAGARVAEAAAHDAAPAGRQRREHGGGLAALRRQHLAAARRHATSSARRPS